MVKRKLLSPPFNDISFRMRYSVTLYISTCMYIHNACYMCVAATYSYFASCLTDLRHSLLQRLYTLAEEE